jgi:hypothetical protein
MLAAGEADPAIDGMQKDAGRSAAGLCAAYLHASGGLTLPRLKALMATFGLVSPGRARALLIYMHYLGYLEMRRVRERGKSVLYKPTAHFLSSHREHMRAVIDGVLVLEPAVGRLLDRFEAPGVYDAFVRSMGECFLDGSRQGHDQDVYFRVFMHRHAGIQIMHALLAEAPEAAFPPEGPLPFSGAAAARRFKVSRVHVRRLLEAGRAEGLLELGDGTVALTPAGREAVDWVFATQMILYLITVARTLKAMPQLMEPGEAPALRQAGAPG